MVAGFVLSGLFEEKSRDIMRMREHLQVRGCYVPFRVEKAVFQVFQQELDCKITRSLTVFDKLQVSGKCVVVPSCYQYWIC